MEDQIHPMSLKPIIPGGFYQFGGSAPPPSSSPGLPTWTFAAGGGDPASGQFTTDNASPNSTSTLKISNFPKYDAAGIGMGSNLQQVPVNALIVLVSSTGQQYSSVFTGASDGGAFSIVSTGGFGALPNWSGDFQLSFWPSFSMVSTVTLGQVLSNSGITPAPDGTVTPVTSITTQTGIVTSDS